MDTCHLIGYMEGIADALNSIRGFNMACQVVVQSLSQWQERYPGKEWENQLATFDQTLYLGCNDLTSAKYISEKCGKITISVRNNQFPLMPLFSPVYHSTRPYSQTRSNTQRDLMLPDEVLRLDRQKCIALFQGRKPALLWKLTPEELPGYDKLETCQVGQYVPAWKQRMDAQAAKTKQKAPKAQSAPPPAPKPAVPKSPTDKKAGPDHSAPVYDLIDPSDDEAPDIPPGLSAVDVGAVRGDGDALEE